MSVLDHILQSKREKAAAARSRGALAEFERMTRDAPPPRGFLRRLDQSTHPIALIAEVKKASPVKGVLRHDFDPVRIAKSYEEVGADALSVLTDEEFFQGSTRNLLLARKATSLPVLRKDFTTDALHIFEARAMGADAVLLIVAALSDEELAVFLALAEELGMDVLVEVHSLIEAERALAAGASIVGVNNRDLASFATNLEASEQIIPKIRARCFPVSESALSSPDDVDRVQRAGARAVLIGSAFCREVSSCESMEEQVSRRVLEVMGW